MLKTLLTFILAGAFVGLASGSYFGPKWLEWDNTATLAPTQTMCNLPEIIRLTSAKLLHYQLVGTLVGASAFLVLGIAFVVMRRNRGVPPPSQLPMAG